MTAKEILENIKKALFEGEPAPAPVAPVVAEPAIHKLSDGTDIMISALEVGGDVMIAGAPAPAGTYTLEDLSSIVVGEDAKIAEIVPAPAVDPAAPELPEDMNAKFEARIAALELGSQEFAAAYNETSAGYKSAFEAFETKIAGQNEIIGQLVQLCEQLTALPTAEVPEPRKVSSFSRVETGKSKLNKYAEAAQKIAEKHNS